MADYERTVLHHILNRHCGEGKTELGLIWYAEKLKRDIDRGWRHFWAQPHRLGLEPPETSWRVNRTFLFGRSVSASPASDAENDQTERLL